MKSRRSTKSLLDAQPKVAAPLDPGFCPAALANRQYRKAVAAAAKKVEVGIAVERNNGLVARHDLDLLPPGSSRDGDSVRYLERQIKFLLWSIGGWKIHLSGPEALCGPIRAQYGAGGARAFDAELMARVYGRPFEVALVPRAELPKEKTSASSIGGHLDGCRIGFDLGASDYKLAAVIDGEAVFSTELPWDPKREPDPAYHYRTINDGLKLAAKHLPRVDAIGGSAAGIYIDNQVMVASLFRAVPLGKFAAAVKPMFLNMQKAWGVPLVVINDGDVTALAGAMSLNKHAMLGIAMGSSEAGGYLDRAGSLLGWLTELAFAPVDYNPAAAADEWSGDRGVGALYFSQQAVNKLAPAAGFNFPKEMDLPERLKEAQKRADAGDRNALKIFETIGVYLGYAIPHYADFYDFENMLILGRVTSGAGGEVIMKKAREALQKESPGLAAKITLHVPDERSRRVGQAVAAASLPEIKKK